MQTRVQRFSLLLPVIVLVGVLAWGVASIVGLSLQDRAALLAGFFQRADYVDALLRTHALSIAATLLCIALGYPLACYIHQYQGNRNRLIVLVITPWLVSIVVRSFGWVVVLGPRGLLNSLLIAVGATDAPLRMMFNSTGIVVGLVHLFLPFMVLSVLAVLSQIDRAMGEAAASLGAGRLAAFMRVTLPLSMPGILSGAMLVYLSCMGSVVTPLLLGGLSEKMLGTQIYVEMFTAFDFPKSSSMAVLLVASSLAVVVPLLWYERRVSRRQSIAKV